MGENRMRMRNFKESYAEGDKKYPTGKSEGIRKREKRLKYWYQGLVGIRVGDK